MKDHDWSTFTTKIHINAEPERVYRAWLTQTEMENWFLKRCTFGSRERNELAQSGDEYSWTWYTKDDFTDTGKVLETQSPNYLKFTFGPATCAVNITEDAGATLVKLVQENIPTDEKSKVMWNLGCQTGWTYFFVVLKGYLENGIDLREKDPRRLDDCSEYHD